MVALCKELGSQKPSDREGFLCDPDCLAASTCTNEFVFSVNVYAYYILIFFSTSDITKFEYMHIDAKGYYHMEITVVYEDLTLRFNYQNVCVILICSNFFS